MGTQRGKPSCDFVFLRSQVLIVRQRRREQNRVAQRAFRERKESKLKQLEKRISELKVDKKDLEQRYNNLRTAHLRLQSGLKILLGASGTIGVQDSDPCLLAQDGKG